MPRQKKEDLYMNITFPTLLVWLIISALVGIIAELIAGRRGPGGILQQSAEGLSDVIE